MGRLGDTDSRADVSLRDYMQVLQKKVSIGVGYPYARVKVKGDPARLR